VATAEEPSALNIVARIERACDTGLVRVGIWAFSKQASPLAARAMSCKRVKWQTGLLMSIAPGRDAGKFYSTITMPRAVLRLELALSIALPMDERFARWHTGTNALLSYTSISTSSAS